MSTGGKKILHPPTHLTVTTQQVYFDIEIGGDKAGRIVMELAADVAPKTAGTCVCPLVGLVGRPIEEWKLTHSTHPPIFRQRTESDWRVWRLHSIHPTRPPKNPPNHQQRTSVRLPPARLALPTRALPSTASFPSSCCRAATSPRGTAPVASPSTGAPVSLFFHFMSCLFSMHFTHPNPSLSSIHFTRSSTPPHPHVKFPTRTSRSSTRARGSSPWPMPAPTPTAPSSSSPPLRPLGVSDVFSVFLAFANTHFTSPHRSLLTPFIRTYTFLKHLQLTASTRSLERSLKVWTL